jgi:hypothetical protein
MVRNLSRFHLPPENPISAALMMINGNGTRKKKIAINAAAYA